MLVDGNLIKQIAKGIKAPKGSEVIDSWGKAVIPGFIDVHRHLSLAEIPSLSVVYFGDAYEIGIRMAQSAANTLMRGFITVRDMGGPVFSLKKMIDAGEVVGPRILPSGPFLRQADILTIACPRKFLLAQTTLITGFALACWLLPMVFLKFWKGVQKILKEYWAIQNQFKSSKGKCSS